MCPFGSALPEDANRAIELKNGSTVGGRRITVKQATHRPSLKERRTKAAQGCCCSRLLDSFNSITQFIDIHVASYFSLGISLPDINTQAESDNKDSLIPETDKQGISLA